MSIVHVNVLKLLLHSTTMTVSNKYNTASSLFLLVFFMLARRLHLGRGTTAPEGETGRRERREVADSA